jgi:uncharacterized protein YbjT (DUF2867 family)
MKVVIVGGTGLIGRKLAALLESAGHEAAIAAPSRGVDSVTGVGVAPIMKGADVVVDVSNSPSFEDRAVLEFFEASTRNLLAAEAEAGVRHHVALSVVGTDRMLDSGYFRAKFAQEALIRAGKVPFTIVRATQFFEFLDAIAHANTVGDTVRVSPAKLQPMAADDVAKALAVVVGQSPLNGICEVAGPKALGGDELVRRALAERRDPRHVQTDPSALYFGSKIDDASLTPAAGARLGSTTLEHWLASSSRAA